MSELYASAPIAIRGDLVAAHTRAWERLGRPGTWWDGGQRAAIAAETRHAPSCALCRRRQEALSPAAIEGKHDSLGVLPEIVVEVVHRVRTDPARLSEGCFAASSQPVSPRSNMSRRSASSRMSSRSTR